MCILNICVTDLASPGQCGKHLVNSCILEGILLQPPLSVCSEQMCFIGTGCLVHLCLCKLQWFSNCVIPSSGVPQATFRGSASTFPL